MSGLSRHSRKCLWAPVTGPEIKQTIKWMKAGKAPGPADFCLEWYSVLTDTFSPALAKSALEN